MSTYEFDTAYSAVTGERVASAYVPTVENDTEHDILIDGMTREDSLTFKYNSESTGWNALTGRTGQHGYNGAVMHASESVEDDMLRQWVRDAGGDTFAIVEVGGHDDAPVFPEEPDYCEVYGCAHDPAGWAVLYQPAAEIAQPCEWFVNKATEPAWCCGNHMYDGTHDYPFATSTHPEECPFADAE